MALTAAALAVDASNSNNESSAKSRWLTLGADGANLIPVIIPHLSASCSSAENPSAHNKKR
jgi:hypothetical protein